MASFVEDPVKGDHEVGFIVASGHAGIARAEAGAEGVGTGVEAASGDIEADFRKEGLKELLLVRAGVVAAKIGTGGGRGEDEGFLGDGDEAWAEFSEKSSYVFGQPARFVPFKKGIVRLVGIAPEISHLAREGEKFFNVRGKGGEMGVFAGLNPCGAGEADGELVFFHEFCRDTGSPFIVVSPAGDGSCFGGEGREGSAFALIEPAGDVSVGREAM
jgi:hypothetical protein